MINSKSSYPVANELGSFVLLIIMRDLTIVIVPKSNLHVISVNVITKCSLFMTIINAILSVISSIGLCSINN